MLKAGLIGNLGGDPEMRYSASGTGLLRFNVASNYRVKNDAGEWEDRVEWVRVTVFGARAESLANYLKKGSRVFVDGRLEARPWNDQSGNARAGLEVIGETVELLTPRGDDQQPARRPVAAAAALDDLDDALPF